MNYEQILDESIFKVGKVISVDGRTVRIRVDKTKNTSHLLFKGTLIKNISVGSYIKISKGFIEIIGKVEGEYIKEDKVALYKDYVNQREKVERILNVSLLGYFEGDNFERGIKELPLIDNSCFLLIESEFNQVHNFVSENDTPLTVGSLSLEKGQKIQLGINNLFASHIGIFGNTGSGKSYTLAKIYRELFLRFHKNKKFRENSKFFLIDFNGEYANSDPDSSDIIIEKELKDVYCLSTRTKACDQYPITSAAINDSDFWVVFLEATEKTQTPFLRRAIDNNFLEKNTSNEADLKLLINKLITTVATELDRNLDRAIILNFLREINSCVESCGTLENLIDDYNTHLKFNTTNKDYYYEDSNKGKKIYNNQDEFKSDVVAQKINDLQLNAEELDEVESIRLRIIIQYYEEIIKGFSNKDHLAPLIKRMDKRFSDLRKVIKIDESNKDNKKNLTIVSLKDVNVHIRKIIPLLLCKQLYNEKKQNNDDSCYLNIIIDEAHNILSQFSERESEQWKDYRLESFEEIIKEGRKFGVFLTIASQRPSDISPTIISQLHNYFLHRLINNEDIKAIEKTVSYLDKVSFEYLPILPTGTCILAGLTATVPVVIDIDEIIPSKHEPKNKTMTLVDKWLD